MYSQHFVNSCIMLDQISYDVWNLCKFNTVQTIEIYLQWIWNVRTTWSCSFELFNPQVMLVYAIVWIWSFWLDIIVHIIYMGIPGFHGFSCRKYNIEMLNWITNIPHFPNIRERMREFPLKEHTIVMCLVRNMNTLNK